MSIKTYTLKCDFLDTSLEYMDLTNANFEGSNLSFVSFNSSNLSKANLNNTILLGTDFALTKLEDTFTGRM